jgi:5'-phosphate synthase pdxT subunit
MFERFTGQARQVVVLAQEEARMLGHGYIGTEHILLGLLAEGEGPAAQALTALGISLDAAREQVAEIVGEGAGAPSGHIPFTGRAKKVLELSLREAQRLGDSYIDTEHILLGVAREGEGVGAQVLDRLGASTDRVLAQVLATKRTAPGGELRRASIGRMPVERPIRLREVMSRLDEIAGRLTAIEDLLAEMQASEVRQRGAAQAPGRWRGAARACGAPRRAGVAPDLPRLAGTTAPEERCGIPRWAAAFQPGWGVAITLGVRGDLSGRLSVGSVPVVGVLALQGDVVEHLRALAQTGATPVSVRRPDELAAVDGLVIPGGESTTMWKLATAFEVAEPLRKRLSGGMPAFGSCAGMIMLADRLLDGVEGQETLGGIGMTVRRNAFGRQVDSFESDVCLDGIASPPDPPFRAVFIRAPWVEAVSEQVTVLGTERVTGRIVAVRQGPLLATSFHPELTGDLRIHRYFVDMVKERT